MCRWHGRALPASGNALLPAGTPAPPSGPEPGGGRLLQEVPLLLAGQRQVSALSEVVGVARRMSLEVLTFGDFVTIRTKGSMQAIRLQDYKYIPSPPTRLNVMYCVRVSLWTVKIFLAQHSIEGVVSNLYISLNIFNSASSAAPQISMYRRML